MNILLSNDDGYRAEGLRTLAKALQALGRVVVVAPDRNRSGASSSLTLDVPIRCERIEKDYYVVTGSPADCIHVGCYEVMNELPDLVVAGINHGANLGDDVLYSGTVAAAMEGRHLGVPAIAVSLVSRTGPHFDTAALWARQCVEWVSQGVFNGCKVLNVNVPNVPASDIKGYALTRLGGRHRGGTLIQQKDPKGRPIYWYGPPNDGEDIGPGTDFHAVAQNQVSLTPIVTDLTDYQALTRLNHHFEQLKQETSDGR